MRNRHTVSLLALSALMTAAATAQPQTTTDTGTQGTTAGPSQTMPTSQGTSTSGTSTTTGTTGTSTTGTTGTSTSTGTTDRSHATGMDTGTTTGTGMDRGTTTGTTTGTGMDRGTTTGTTTGTTGTTGTTTTTGMDRAMDSGAMMGATGSSKLQGQDAEFLKTAMQGGREEVRKAQAAMRNAQRAETRNIASMMLEDHRRSNERLEELAQQKGWSVPAATDMDMESGAEADQPAGMATGRDFDQQFMNDEIRHHRETIALYRTQASSGSDQDLRQFARDALPQLEHHLEMLEGGNTQK